MHFVYLLIGSNEGDRSAQLEQACDALSEKAGKIVQRSRVYETASWGVEDLPAHYNQAVYLETELAPPDLLNIIQETENAMGRIRQQKWGLRNIDIDIIYFDDLVIQKPELWIPHPLMQERNFVLVPLTEIAPDFVHPLFHKTNRQLLAESRDKLPVKPV